MASKKRQSKKNSGPGNPAKAAPRGRSVHRIQAEQAVDALRDQYVRWVAAQVPGFSTADAAQASRSAFRIAAAMRSGKRSGVHAKAGTPRAAKDVTRGEPLDGRARARDHGGCAGKGRAA